jgi:hypothetical protein
MTAWLHSAIGLALRVGLWLLAGFALPVAAQDGRGDEALIKAAFVYNFAKFTRWPEAALGEPGAPMSLCLVGEDALADALAGLAGKTIKGRLLAVHPLKGAALSRSCQILYVSAAEQKHHPELLKAARTQAILTVSDGTGFAEVGGVVELFRDQGRVRFVVNLGAARGAGLEISPSLLSLAVVVGQD